MNLTPIASGYKKQLLVALMVVGIFFAFTGNEMVGRDAVATGILLMISAMAAAIVAALGLSRLNDDATGSSYCNMRMRQGKLPEHRRPIPW